LAAAKKPRRHKAYFEVRFSRRDARGTSRTRLSAREVRAAKQSSSLNRYACVNRRTANVKKARESLSCWLRTDKVFVYFTNLKMRDLKSAKKFEDRTTQR